MIIIPPKKNKEEVWAIRATKYKKICGRKYTRARARARAPLVRKYTNRILESKDGTTSLKYIFVIHRLGGP